MKFLLWGVVAFFVVVVIGNLAYDPNSQRGRDDRLRAECDKVVKDDLQDKSARRMARDACRSLIPNYN